MTHPTRPAWVVCALIVLAFAATASAQGKAKKKAQAPKPTPGVHAVLINGGGSAKANYLSHLEHIQDMHEVLLERGIEPEKITIFSSDGNNKGKDLVTRAVGASVPDRWLVSGTPVGNVLRPPRKMVDTTAYWPDAPKLRPATYGALRSWFKASRKTIVDGSTLLVFVTDHGTKGKDSLENGNISLWNESMSVLEFRALLSQLVPGVRIVLVMSQCFSGSFANSIYGLGRAIPDGNVCGFFSTTDDRYAYGCYAEGRARDKIGHAFQFIDALRSRASTDDAHRLVLSRDDTPDVPLRSSDVFLDHVLQDEALAKDKELAARVDELLRDALTRAKDYESELRGLDQVAQQFGVASPRRLTELDKDLETVGELIEKSEGTEELWDKALGDLKQNNLDDFLASKQGAKWKQKLDAKKLKKASDAQRDKLAQSFLPALAKFTRGRPEIFDRMQTLRKKANKTGAIRYRMQKREGGLLRLRALLVRIAGLEFMRSLDAESPDRLALESLRGCEGHVFGKLGRKAKPNVAKPLPELADDVDALLAASPSWLGISYRPVDPDPESGVGTGAVAVRRVAPESPAAKAGLKSKDVVYGAEGKAFASRHELREWVMTAPQNKPLALLVKRGGEDVKIDISLAAHPLKVSFTPKPTEVGQLAPVVTLKDLDGKDVKLDGRAHLLVYWATWCGPCKKALPEVADWARSTGTTVVMVSDEDAEVQKKFLSTFKGVMPKLRTVDAPRDSFRAHGIRGTPTFILVDATGVIRHRQTGYGKKHGLKFPGWTWKKAKR